MHVSSARAHLARIGVTGPIIAAECVDPFDPHAIRGLVEDLLRGILANNDLTSARQFAELQMALGQLRTPAEVADGVTVADLIARLRPPATDGAGDDDVEAPACLTDR